MLRPELPSSATRGGMLMTMTDPYRGTAHPEFPPHPCGDPTCDDDHDAIADRALDGRGEE